MAGEGIGNTTRVAKATLAKWVKKISDQAVQRYILTTKLKQKGRIDFGNHGGELRWVFRYRYHDLQQHVDADNRQFERVRTIENANLPWRGYDVTDAITLREKDIHGGPEAVVEIFNNRKSLMEQSANQQLSKEWYKDGNAAGNEQRFHGIESFGSTTGQTNTDALATTLNDTYAGHSTSYTTFLASAVKGTDEEYGAWSPVIVNSNVHDSGGNNKAWADFADEYIRLGLIEATYGDTEFDRPDLISLRPDSYRALLNLLDDKERITFVRGSDLGMWKVGNMKYLELDGCLVGFDFGIPSTDPAGNTVHGYGFTTSRMKLKVLGSKKAKSLWRIFMNYDPHQNADLIQLHLSGNLCFESPRHFIMFKELSA